MLFRPLLTASVLALSLGSTSAFADIVTVTSYDMNNGNGATQFTGGPNYLDFSYTNSTTHILDPNASKNGSDLAVPNNTSPKVAPLSGGTGILTDGVIATQVYSLVTGATGAVDHGSLYTGSSQYVGWKYQDPTIVFNLAAGSKVGSINLYVAANNPAIGDANGLVAAPGNVLLNINGQSIAVTLTEKSINAFTTELILSGFGSISSSSIFSLTLDRGPLQQDGIDYYNDHVKTNASGVCTNFCDPDAGPYSSGFRQEAAGGQTGNLAANSGLEPWIMLSEVEFMTTAVPEPSTWMMMILGFLGLAFLARRKANIGFKHA